MASICVDWMCVVWMDKMPGYVWIGWMDGLDWIDKWSKCLDWIDKWSEYGWLDYVWTG